MVILIKIPFSKNMLLMIFSHLINYGGNIWIYIYKIGNSNSPLTTFLNSTKEEEEEGIASISKPNSLST